MKAKDDALITETIAGAKLGANGWYRNNCPFCALGFNDDKRWSWGFNPESGYWHCFKCSAEGWQRTDTVTFVTRPKIVPAPTDDFPLPSDFVPLAGFAPDPEDLLAMLDQRAGALAYLERRGISAELAKRLGFGICSGAGGHCSCCEDRPRCRYRNRLIMPVQVAGVRRGFVARALARSKVPYLYPQGMPRGEILINQDVLLRETDEPALVMEGWLDMLPYWDTVDTVGCLGKPGAAHIELLARAKRPIVLVLDGDAWALARQVAQLLGYRWSSKASDSGQPPKRAGYVKLPPTRDPNDVSMAGRGRWLLERAWRSVGKIYEQSSRGHTQFILDTCIT